MRENLKKGQRFDILKRDLFTCQYCGRRPPNVILHVDHILAVVLGGGSSDDNLVTSCSDCNLGKSDKPMDRVLSPIPLSIEGRKEKLDQLAAYQQFLAEESLVYEKMVDKVCIRWAVRDGQDENAESWSLPWELEGAARKFVKMLPMDGIFEAIDIAFDRYPKAVHHYRFKFFCGICWKKYRDISKIPKPE